MYLLVAYLLDIFYLSFRSSETLRALKGILNLHTTWRHTKMTGSIFIFETNKQVINPPSTSTPHISDTVYITGELTDQL